MEQNLRRIIILTGAYDDHHLSTRTDNPGVCTSAGKRLMLYRAIAAATGCSPLLLSPQPRGRGRPTAMAGAECRFGEFRQHFAGASGVRKIRYFADIISYIRHVYRHTRNGDTFIVDNYELAYILAIHHCRLRGRKNRILLEYEDGKHLIDRGFPKWVSGLAERMGRTLVQGAILATPSLGERLPSGIPKVQVPGILRPDIVINPASPQGMPVHFIYSGSMDVERGAPLLLDYLESSLIQTNTVYHITGQGNYRERFERLTKFNRGTINFHGCVSEEKLASIRSSCHFGLNLQCSSNPISEVTFPSKTFDYLNAGLRVVSTRASRVEEVLGGAAIYLESETPAGLADAVRRASCSLVTGVDLPIASLMSRYSFEGTVRRLRDLLAGINEP